MSTKGIHFSALAIGMFAGLAGEGAMMAARSFDEKYAPRTVASSWRTVRQRAALQRTGGPILGTLYGLWRGRAGKSPSLMNGLLLGLAAFAVEEMCAMTGRGANASPFKQDFPQLAGEMLRHAVYGVVAAAVYGIIDGRL